MNTSARIITALTITVILSPGALSPEEKGVAIARSRHTVVAKAEAPRTGSIVGASPRQQAAATAALNMFEDGELELPPVDIYFHDSPENCDNRPGYYHRQNGRDIVDICQAEDYPEVFLEQLLVHELAHAWDAHALTNEIRDEFMQMRGTEIWHSREVDWDQRGTEHAAEIITWGIFERPMAVITLDDVGCEQLQAGYELLTGASPNRPDDKLCLNWVPGSVAEPESNPAV